MIAEGLDGLAGWIHSDFKGFNIMLISVKGGNELDGEKTVFDCLKYLFHKFKLR